MPTDNSKTPFKYTVYRTKCLVNNKVYIGKHKTFDPNDDYLRSGKLLQWAIKKHGRENFIKEVLHVFKSEEEMNAKEIELVTEEFCSREDTYNLCPGGRGGWGYVNNSGKRNGTENWSSEQFKYASKMSKLSLIRQTKEYKKRHANSVSLAVKGNTNWLGKTHSKETIKKMSGPRLKSSGVRNSQYGTMWITDGKKSKKIKKDQSIPEGWIRGRKIS